MTLRYARYSRSSARFSRPHLRLPSPRSVSTSKKTPSLTGPVSEQRHKLVTNEGGNRFCRAQPAENMTISWTEPFQKQVGPRQSRKAKMLRSVGYDPVTLPSKAAKNLALSRLRACSWQG